MLNPKKEADKIDSGTVALASCPICKAITLNLHYMQDSETKKRSKWYSCSCGIIFNADKPSKVYDKAYYDAVTDYESKKNRDSWEYPIYLYAPIIEEAVYRRKALLVGYSQPYQMNEFVRRGWVTQVIDKNSELSGSDKILHGDFESYEFPTYKITDYDGSEIISKPLYDLIWFYHTLECFLDPVTALSKSRDLLAEDGILYIGTPDTDFIHTRSLSGFKHWKPDMNYIMWNKRSLTSCLEKLGFEVIMARRNYEYRFPYQDDIHIIAQKKYY